MALEAPSPETLPPMRVGALASLALVILSVVFAVAGQMTLKAAMIRVGRIGEAQVADAVATVARVAREPLVWGGLALFGVSAVFWLVVLSRVPLSVAYPSAGVNYVLVVTFSRVLLHEHVPPLRWAGVAVVAVGIAIIGWSFRPSGG